jgi:arylsulfatase A-like enzyme
MLLYLDDVLGRLFESVAASGLADSTYILLTADNGPALPKEFLDNEALRLVRMIPNTTHVQLCCVK